jgi:hypothetical protein
LTLPELLLDDEPDEPEDEPEDPEDEPDEAAVVLAAAAVVWVEVATTATFVVAVALALEDERLEEAFAWQRLELERFLALRERLLWEMSACLLTTWSDWMERALTGEVTEEAKRVRRARETMERRLVGAIGYESSGRRNECEPKKLAEGGEVEVRDKKRCVVVLFGSRFKCERKTDHDHQTRSHFITTRSHTP